MLTNNDESIAVVIRANTGIGLHLTRQLLHERRRARGATPSEQVVSALSAVVAATHMIKRLDHPELDDLRLARDVITAS